MKNSSSHLTTLEIRDYVNNHANPNDSLIILEHISSCDSCMNLYLEILEEKELIAMPNHLKSDIIMQLENKKEVKAILTDSLSKKASNNRQFYLYTLKVCCAMCGALFITFSSAFNTPINSLPKDLSTVTTTKLNNFYKQLNDFSKKIIFKEATQNDQEKK